MGTYLKLRAEETASKSGAQGISGSANKHLISLAKAKRYRPHVLITDIKMPGLSGLDVLEDLWETIPSMGIIVITAFPHAIPDFLTLSKKAHDLVMKPLNLYYLERSVLTRIAKMIA